MEKLRDATRGAKATREGAAPVQADLEVMGVPQGLGKMIKVGQESEVEVETETTMTASQMIGRELGQAGPSASTTCAASMVVYVDELRLHSFAASIATPEIYVRKKSAHTFSSTAAGGVQSTYNVI